MKDGHTHYTHSLGLLELREAICDYYGNTYGVSVDPGQVVVRSGTSPVMFCLFRSCLNPGDQVIISDPHYACYPNFIKFVDGRSGHGSGLRGGRVSVPPRGHPRKDHRPKTKGHLHQFPVQPDGQPAFGRPDEAIAAMAAPEGPFHHLRRNLSRAGLRREGAFHPGVYRSCLRPQRVFQALRHDRSHGSDISSPPRRSSGPSRRSSRISSSPPMP